MRRGANYQNSRIALSLGGTDIVLSVRSLVLESSSKGYVNHPAVF